MWKCHTWETVAKSLNKTFPNNWTAAEVSESLFVTLSHFPALHSQGTECWHKCLYKVAKLLFLAKYWISHGMALVTLSKDSFPKSVTKRVPSVYIPVTRLMGHSGVLEQRWSHHKSVGRFYNRSRVWKRIAILSTHDSLCVLRNAFWI